MFDWTTFFDQRNIQVARRGHGLSGNRVAIRCPFCGPNDDFHMIVSLDGQGWKCWKQSREHKGRNPIRLIQALLNCSIEQARQIAGYGTTLPTDLLSQVKGLIEKEEPKPAPPIKMPDEFKLFTGMPASRPYVDYLKRRGLDMDFVRQWGLRYCTVGPFQGRIIFPIYHHGELVTWTGRTIYPIEELRYKTLTTDKEKAADAGLPAARRTISECLLWFDHLTNGGNTLVLCEGPFDAAKVNYLGLGVGIRATCFFTMQPSHTQVDLLHSVIDGFKHRYLLLDRGTLHVALRLQWELRSLNVELRILPQEVKDPGEIKSTADLINLID